MQDNISNYALGALKCGFTSAVLVSNHLHLPSKEVLLKLLYFI